jgi:hypothetical protein
MASLGQSSNSAQSLRSDIEIGNSDALRGVTRGTAAEEKAFVANKIKALGLEPLPAGLGGSSNRTLGFLGHTTVNTEWGKAIVPKGDSFSAGDSQGTYAKLNVNRSLYEKRASDLADQLNDLVNKGKGDSKLFKALDKEYQMVKSVRDNPTAETVGKTVRYNDGIVSDITGAHFNLRGVIGSVSEQQIFKTFSKENLTSNELYALSSKISRGLAKGYDDVIYVPTKINYDTSPEALRTQTFYRIPVTVQGESRVLGKPVKVTGKKGLEEAVFGYINQPW